MNEGLAAVDASDESMVGASAEMHEANAHMRTGLDYVMSVAAHNKRIITVLREANSAALALLNEGEEQI